MDVLNDFIVMIVLAACIGVGFIIKHSLSFIPNQCIPLILGILGVCLNIWYQGSFSLEILVGGMASGLAATGAFEMVRNLTGKAVDKP